MELMWCQLAKPWLLHLSELVIPHGSAEAASASAHDQSFFAEAAAISYSAFIGLHETREERRSKFDRARSQNLWSTFLSLVLPGQRINYPCFLE